MKIGAAFIAVALLTIAAPAPACAADWPHWRGPSRDGRATGRAAESGESGEIRLKLHWRRPVFCAARPGVLEPRPAATPEAGA